jgi:adenosylcobinamide amidohydrolase
MVSWAVVNGGARFRAVVGWYFVQKDELKNVPSASSYLKSRMVDSGIKGAVGMITGRRLHAYVEERGELDDAICHVVLTAGFSNALRAGDPPSHRPKAGTINILCWLSKPLNPAASLEALALVAEARTAAILDSGVRSSVSGAPATGTGTDCIVIASPALEPAASYCGKHLVTGHLIGDTVYRAMYRASIDWQRECRPSSSGTQA